MRELIAARESGDLVYLSETGLAPYAAGWNSFVTLAAFDLQRQNVRSPDPSD